MKKLLVAVAVVLVVAGLVLAYFIAGAHGFSTRGNPTAIERTLAQEARHFAIPRSARDMPNPVVLTPELLVEARRHFADHCSICHANDGSGDTEIGRMLYPKAPDMRKHGTQSMSDGELYFTIHNGIRMSGMPGWGAESGQDNDSWALVHFIRHLPQLTASEIEDMKHYNPRSPMEMQEEKEEEEFLNGSPQK